MATSHDARASMFGLAHHSHSYQRLARLAAPLYRRVAADVGSAGLETGARLLDVGTGPGMVPLRLAAERPDLRIDAIDLAPEMIERATQSAAGAGLGSRLTFAVGDVAALPFPDDSFDLIVSSISQHHWVDPAAGLAEIARVLRPGAQAWIYDFRWALGRAGRAAVGLGPAVAVHRQSPLVGTPWFNPVGRLVLQA